MFLLLVVVVFNYHYFFIAYWIDLNQHRPSCKEREETFQIQLIKTWGPNMGTAKSGAGTSPLTPRRWRLPVQGGQRGQTLCSPLLGVPASAELWLCCWGRKRAGKIRQEEGAQR